MSCEYCEKFGDDRSGLVGMNKVVIASGLPNKRILDSVLVTAKIEHAVGTSYYRLVITEHYYDHCASISFPIMNCPWCGKKLGDAS